MSWWTLCTSSRLSANQHINSWIYILGCQLFRISLHLWLLGKHDTSTTNKSSFECQWMKQGKKTTRDTRKIASCIWNINHYNYIIKPQKNAKNLRARNARASTSALADQQPTSTACRSLLLLRLDSDCRHSACTRTYPLQGHPVLRSIHHSF